MERKAHTGSGNFIWFDSDLARTRTTFHLIVGWAHQRDRLPLVTPINSKIILVHGDDGMPRIELAHPNQAKIGQVGLSILIAFRDFRQVLEVSIAIKRDPQHFVFDQGEHVATGLQMKRGFGQHSLTSQKGLGNSFRYIYRPFVMLIVQPSESNDETGVCDSLHEGENPLREETPTGPPRIAPAE